MSNKALWDAIDALARRLNMSCSRLAVVSGLNATTFNKSKRTTRDGKPRYLSMGTIQKVLAATNTPMAEFTSLMTGDASETDDAPGGD
ncbi:MAG: hypothetical protein K2L95_04690 [Alphaproteobacteria bacterium]|nr:hypothetical protein [Alphaproteobacteria bacterium]MDE6571481.1 hypothetical protein [Alphaproteobacteria bacterium]